MTFRARRGLVLAIPIAAIIVLGFALVTYAYWPGVMIDDARWQYQQVVDNSYEDWHPPLMAWVWRRLAFVLPGPASMLLLQLLLYWAGIALIAWWAYRRGQPGLAAAIAGAGWLPIPLALGGTVVKDVLMAGCLLCGAGLLLCRTLAARRMPRAAMSLASIAFLFAAAALRLNAVFACLPLLLAALPAGFTRNKVRMAASAAAAAMALLAIGPAISMLVQAEHTDVDLSLIIFDLGGITEHSKVSQFPDFGVRDPVAVNHRCYDPFQWDSYSTWAKSPCPLGFERFEALVEQGDVSVKALWLKAVLTHPVAYAEHRLDHFNRSAWFLVPVVPVPAAWSQSVPNPWGFQVHRSALLTIFSRYADIAGATPLGWPIFWIALALAALIIGCSTAASPAVRALAASAFVYGFSYLVVGVAVGLRYYVWTISGAALAALVLAVELHAERRAVSRGAILASTAVLVVPTLMAIVARWALA